MRSISAGICAILTVLPVVVLTNVSFGIERRTRTQAPDGTTDGKTVPGVIECVVTDDGTGQGMEGVTVEVIGTGLRQKTDRDGRILIVPIAPGNYSLAISDPDYVPDTAIDIAVKSHARSLLKRKLTRIPMGRIVGVITDEKSGETVVGGSVMIVGMKTKGAMTDFDGRFVIGHVPVGTYDLRITHLDFDSLTVRGVEIKNREDTDVSCQLKMKPWWGR